MTEKDRFFDQETGATIITYDIPHLLLIKRKVYEDERGFFSEVFHMEDIKKYTGIDFQPVRMNHSCSLPRVIRGLHSEDMNKLIYPVSGKMFAAIADVKPESPTFGKVETFYFDESDSKALFIPKGVANSICVVGEEPVEYIYLVDEHYHQGTVNKGIAWNDPDLNIKWPIENPIISKRDRNNPTLKKLFSEKFK